MMYFFRFSSIITLSSVILFIISGVLLSVFFLVTRMIPGFLNFPFMYCIRLARLRSYSLLRILRTCMAAGSFPTSYIVSAMLVQYSMLRVSAWFFLPEYSYGIPVIISVLLALYVTCENLRCIWVSCCLL